MQLNQCLDFSDHNKLEIAIISDTHGEIHAEILRQINQCDIVIHAGDICGYQVLAQIQPRQGHIIAVAGNNDRPYVWDVKHWSIVKSLPQQVQIQVTGGQIAVEHGHVHDMYKPSHSDLRQAHPDARLVIYGHTHHLIIDDQQEGWVINPGAAGKTRTHGGASWVKLIVTSNEWKTIGQRIEDKKQKVDCAK